MTAATTFFLLQSHAIDRHGFIDSLAIDYR